MLSLSILVPLLAVLPALWAADHTDLVFGLSPATMATATKEFCEGKDYGSYGQECSSNFTICTPLGESWLMCPFGLVFDEEHQHCQLMKKLDICGQPRSDDDDDSHDDSGEPHNFGNFDNFDNFDSDEDQNTTPGVFAPNVPLTCSGLVDGFHPVTQCSASVVQCINGQPNLFECPTNLVFDPVSLQCLDISLVRACAMSTFENTGFTGFQRAAGDEDCSGKSDGLFLHAKCDGHFLTCSGGVSRVMACPDGLLYDDVNQICDFPGNLAGCGSNGNGGAEGPCAKNGFFSFGKCSDNFTACTEGREITMFCPAQLAFDEARQLCDYPNSVPECNSSEGSGEEVTTESSPIVGTTESSGAELPASDVPAAVGKSDTLESSGIEKSVVIVKPTEESSGTIELSGDVDSSGEVVEEDLTMTDASGDEEEIKIIEASGEASGEVHLGGATVDFEGSGTASIEEITNTDASGDSEKLDIIEASGDGAAIIDVSGEILAEGSGVAVIEILTDTDASGDKIIIATIDASGEVDGVENSGSSGQESSGFEESGEFSGGLIIDEEVLPMGDEKQPLLIMGQDESSGDMTASGMQGSGIEASGESSGEGSGESSGESSGEFSGEGSGEFSGEESGIEASGLASEHTDIKEHRSQTGKTGSGLCVGKADGFHSTGCSSVLIACSGEATSELTCPSHLVFDQKRQICDYPKAISECDVSIEINRAADDGDSDSSAVQTRQLGSNQANFGGFGGRKPQCTVGILTPWGGQCTNQFISCFFGRPVIMRCQSGSLFSQRFQRCLPFSPRWFPECRFGGFGGFGGNNNNGSNGNNNNNGNGGRDGNQNGNGGRNGNNGNNGGRNGNNGRGGRGGRRDDD